MFRNTLARNELTVSRDFELEKLCGGRDDTWERQELEEAGHRGEGASKPFGLGRSLSAAAVLRIGHHEHRSQIAFPSWLWDCLYLLPLHRRRCRRRSIDIRHRIHLFHHLRRAPNCDREVGYVFGHYAACANGTAFPDSDAGHDGDVAADPAVIPNGDGPRVLDAVAPRLDAYLVRGGEDGDEGSE